MRPTDESPILFVDAVQSLNYVGPGPGDTFSQAGSLLDLATGTFTTPGLFVDGVTGDVAIRGDVTATSFTANLGVGAVADLVVAGFTDPDGVDLSGFTVGASQSLGFSHLTAAAPRFTVEVRNPSDADDYAAVTLTGGASTMAGELTAKKNPSQPLATVAVSATSTTGIAELFVNDGAGLMYASVEASTAGVELATTETLTIDAPAVSIVSPSAFRSALGLTAAATANVQSPTNSPPAGSDLIRAHTNGYIYAGWINTVSGATTDTIARIYASDDAFLRYVTPATFRSQVITPHYVQNTGDTMTGQLTISTTGTCLQIGSGGATANIYFNTSSNDVQITHDATLTLYARNGANTAFATYRGIISDASSIRYKRDVTPVRFGMLAQALAVEPVTFRYRKLRGRGGDEGTGRMLGVIAEQVHTIAPELTHWHAVTGEVEGVSASGLATLAIGAVQELARKVDALGRRLDDLERVSSTP